MSSWTQHLKDGPPVQHVHSGCGSGRTLSISKSGNGTKLNVENSRDPKNSERPGEGPDLLIQNTLQEGENVKMFSLTRVKGSDASSPDRRKGPASRPAQLRFCQEVLRPGSEARCSHGLNNQQMVHHRHNHLLSRRSKRSDRVDVLLVLLRSSSASSQPEPLEPFRGPKTRCQNVFVYTGLPSALDFVYMLMFVCLL